MSFLLNDASLICCIHRRKSSSPALPLAVISITPTLSANCNSMRKPFADRQNYNECSYTSDKAARRFGELRLRASFISYKGNLKGTNNVSNGADPSVAQGCRCVRESEQMSGQNHAASDNRLRCINTLQLPLVRSNAARSGGALIKKKYDARLAQRVNNLNDVISKCCGSTLKVDVWLPPCNPHVICTNHTLLHNRSIMNLLD